MNPWRLLAPQAQELILHPELFELRINVDGRVLCAGMRGSGGPELYDVEPFEVDPAACGRFCSSLASLADEDLHDSPELAARIEHCGRKLRLQLMIPPMTSAPAAVVRVLDAGRLSLEKDYFEKGLMSAEDLARIRASIDELGNVLIVGGMMSGKTTLANAIVAEIRMRHPEDRIVVLEDTPEIHVEGDALSLRACPGYGIADLVKVALRSGGSRICVGEVRDPQAAMMLLDAWSTGHGGGAATLHAEGPETALERLSALCERAAAAQRGLIALAIETIVHVSYRRGVRRIEVYEVESRAGGWKISQA